MHKNKILFAVGIALFAVVLAGVYWSNINRDEQEPKLANTENVAYGSIVVPEGITQFSALGPDGLVSAKLEAGIGKFPAGQYHVGVWQAERKDDHGNTWVLTGRNSGGKGPFEVADDARINLDIGEPIVAIVSGRKIGSKNYSFGQSIHGRLDEHITLTRNGSKPAAPKLRIKNKDGTYDRTFAFQYG
jgi:hypothetical protein